MAKKGKWVAKLEGDGWLSREIVAKLAGDGWLSRGDGWLSWKEMGG